ncbi:hypothetical protein B0H14DRAFT_3483876 [Mycena olivaceomarginata]|nr:hypothetical protein B0H14DRAFT_3483876 [Mycena olivaceomarginata]
MAACTEPTPSPPLSCLCDTPPTLGCTLANSTSRPAEHRSASRSASLYADSHRKTPSPPEQRALNVFPVRPGNAQIHEPWPPALSTSTRQILDTSEAAAFLAPRRLQHELPHQHLAQQQETAARLTALTLLPPSPMLSQEARDEALTVHFALGTSPPPTITTPHTRRDIAG